MTITPFKINIAQAVLDGLQAKLQHADIVPEPATGWQKGTSITYMQELLAYWQTDFDWRKQEIERNQYPHFTTEVNGKQVHFLHIKGQGPNPKPLILTHGWPDSFYRFHKVIPLLTDPAAHGGDDAQSFDLIIPSLPGFGFSELAPLETAADTWYQLMTEGLGYEQFYAAGGDIGAIITKKLAERYPVNVGAIHLIELVVATRRLVDYDLPEFAQAVQFGASPWASIALHRASKAVAYLEGRDYVLPEDIKEVAADVLNHRILLTYEAEADGIRIQDLIDAILRKVPIS